MQWDKLTIVFMSELVSRNDGSTNCQIASYILEHLDEVKKCNITELAKRSHVSVSSMSRFCKEIGLKDFQDLKIIINDARFEFELPDIKLKGDKRINYLGEQIKSCLDQVTSSIDVNSLNAIVKDIYRYDNVALFGLLKAETVAMNLQSDLMILGKQTTTKVSVALQKEYLENASKEDLIILFSYKGIYFDLTKALKGMERKKPKIWFVTGNSKMKKNKFIDHILSFKSELDYISHPFQLQYVGTLIAQNYGIYTNRIRKNVE